MGSSRFGDQRVTGRRRNRRAGLVAAATAVLATSVIGGAPAPAQISPPSHQTALSPGQSESVSKTVTVPFPPDLDFVLDVDLSGSYEDDLPNLRAKAPEIFDAIAARSSNPQFGLVTFVDYPYSPWGNPPDFAYRRDQDLTSDKATWTGAVDAMTIFGGGDLPESQYESLFQAATGAGRDVPGNGGEGGEGCGDVGDVPAGQGISWRPGSVRVIAITTDAAFHVQGDPGSCFPYPGPSRDATIQALLDQGIHVIAIKAPGSGSEMDDLAAATGGAVVTTDATSEEIAEAIVAGLASLRFDITAAPTDCAPLQISFDPTVQEQAPAGAEVTFTETITVPQGAAPGTVTCDVAFFAGESVIGTQKLQVEVPGGRCENLIRGNKKGNKLNGTPGGDEIRGRRGADKIRGKAGDDCLFAGRGKDKVKGGSGDDQIRIRKGRGDRANCGPGDDVVFAGKKDRVKKNCEKVKG